jgi:peptidoglycan/xylan/chitin deacetylase (PgdA/CDA1 family)
MKYIILFSCFFILVKQSYAEIVSREIIALWDQEEYQGYGKEESLIHKRIEVVFNYYGFNLIFMDVNNKKNFELIEEKLKNKNTAGVVTWFKTNEKKYSKQILELYLNIKKINKKILIIGELGVKRDRKYNHSFQELGINGWNFYESGIIRVNEKFYHDKKFNFEKKMKRSYMGMWAFKPKKNESKSLLTLTNSRSEEIAGIIEYPWGLIVQTPFTLEINDFDYRSKWLMDPFFIVNHTFNTGLKPIPDTSSLCGKRLAFIHLDGDGFISISDVDRKSMNGEIFYNEILKKYNYPTSVSLITGEVDSKYLGNEKSEETSKKIIRHENVEWASHTFSHPLSWDLKPPKRDIAIYIKDNKTYAGGPITAYKFKDYHMNYVEEIIKPIEYIDRKFSTHRQKDKIIFWSGNCRPPKSVLSMVESAGYLNINGGDGRFDSIYNSYSHLSPLYRKVDQYTQTYTAMSNENLYTNLWTGNFGGFSKVIETFENTNKPYLIKPVNLYYHFYALEKKTSLASMKTIYDWIGKRELAHVRASDYIKIVNDYQKINIEKISKNAWDIKGHQHLKSIRFETDKFYPDYEKSKNIIGHNFINKKLYVSLGPEEDSHVVLSNKKPNSKYIVTCNGWIQKNGELLSRMKPKIEYSK